TRPVSGEKRIALPPLIPGGGAGRPPRVVDAKETPVRADRNQLDRPPRGLLGELVAALRPTRQHARRKAATLVIERVWQPLMVKAGPRAGLVRSQSESDDIG